MNWPVYGVGLCSLNLQLFDVQISYVLFYGVGRDPDSEDRFELLEGYPRIWLISYSSLLIKVIGSLAMIHCRCHLPLVACFVRLCGTSCGP